AANPGDQIISDNSVHAITLTSGELLLNKNLTIQGPGAGQLTVSGNQAPLIFDVQAGATVTITGLTITGGIGGIYNAGTLTVSGCTVSDNHDLYGGGNGGLDNDYGATVTGSGCTIPGDTSSRSGGGVATATPAE